MIAAFLYRCQRGPGGIVQQRGLQDRLGIGRVCALEYHENIVRVRLKDGFDAQLLQKASVSARNVDAAQVFEHFPQNAALAVFHLAAAAGGPDIENAGGGTILPRQCGFHLPGHLCAIEVVVLCFPGDLRTDFEHAQVILKGVDREVGSVQPHGGKRGLQRHVPVGSSAGQNEIGLTGQQTLHIQFFRVAQIDHVVPQR